MPLKGTAPDVGFALETIRRSVLEDAPALRIALESMPVGVSWATFDDQAIIFTNLRFAELFGYTASEFKNIHDWMDRAYPFAEDRVLISQKWGADFRRSHLHECVLEPVEIRVLCKAGEVKTVIISGVILPKTGWVLVTFVDISDRKRNELIIKAAERKALENQAIYRLLIDHSPEMMVLSPLNGSPRYASPAVESLTGFSADEYLQLRDLQIMHPEDREKASVILEQLRQGQLFHTMRYRTLQKNGEHRWVEATITGYLEPGSDRVGGYVAMVRDFAEQKEREDQLAAEHLQLSKAAFKDDLTGIANRRKFNEALRREGLRQTRSKHALSLLLMDVDCFKQYNDTYGHVAGDHCLQQIAELMTQLLRRESDLVARFGGEEFVALLPMTDLSGAVLLADSIRHAVASLQLPHASSPHNVVTVSVGVASWGVGDQLDCDGFITQADVALYRAKETGRNRTCASKSDSRNSLCSEADDIAGERRRFKRITDPGSA